LKKEIGDSEMRAKFSKLANSLFVHENESVWLAWILFCKPKHAGLRLASKMWVLLMF